MAFVFRRSGKAALERVAGDALVAAKVAAASTTEIRAELAELRATVAAVSRNEPQKSSSATPADRWQKWTAIGSILSVLLVAAGLYLTSRANNASQKATNAQLRLAAQQQTAQRFSDAVGQLGQEDEKRNDKLSLRLGAIYSLRALMKDSPEHEPAVIAILGAFVRTHAAAGPEIPDPLTTGDPPPSGLDVITAVEVLGHRPDPGSASHRLVDLSDTLVSAPKEAVPWGYMDGVHLAGVYLAGANFTNASLAGAVLYGSNMYRARLGGAILNGADVHGVDMPHAELFGTWLNDANLSHANIPGVRLNGARMQRTDLTGANMYGADLRDTDLRAAKGLNKADLGCVVVSENTLFPPDLSNPSLLSPRSQLCEPPRG